MSHSIITQMRILINQIRAANHLYYVMDDPTLSDGEYDSLRSELLKLETDYPDLIQPDSPINLVGDKVSGSLDTVEHTIPMLSLGNVFDQEELTAFIARTKATAYILEYKFDGLAVSLIYKYGRLTQGITRGNGEIGEDVTHKVLTIQNIPHVLDSLSETPVFEVRGEVVMSKAGFKKHNDLALLNGDRVFANTRNAAAGSLRQLSNDKPRPLAFYAYSVNQGNREGAINQSLTLMGLHGLGFSIGEFTLAYHVEDIQAQYDKMIEERDSLPYDIDGMVIKVDHFEEQDKLGFKSREPLWATAYKFPAQAVVTTIEAVDWQLGRTGQLTPVARVTPTHVGGVLVSNVTLHNLLEIRRLDAHIGDRVTLERAGDVIPKITRVWLDMRKDTTPIDLPEHCLSCGSRIELPEGDTVAYCTGGSICPEQAVQAFVHFASRNAMDIDGLAQATIEQLLAHGLIDSFDDLYTLKDRRGELEKIERMGSKSIDKLLAAIEKSKTVPFKRFLYALGIRNVGEGTSKRLSNHYTLEDILEVDIKDLNNIVDIGPITAIQIHTFFNTASNLDMIENLLEAGLNITYYTPVRLESLPLYEQTWVITGSIGKLPRSEIKSFLEEQGAYVASSVTNATDVLLAGDGESGSSKYKKAQKLNVLIMSAETFLSKFNI